MVRARAAGAWRLIPVVLAFGASCALVAGLEDKELATGAPDGGGEAGPSGDDEASSDGAADAGGFEASAGEILASGQNGPLGVAVDGTYVYWSNERAGTIQRLAKTLATPAETIVDGQPVPRHLLVDDAFLYWQNENQPKALLSDGGAETVPLVARIALGGVADPDAAAFETIASDNAVSKVSRFSLYAGMQGPPDDYVFAAEANRATRYRRSALGNAQNAGGLTGTAATAVAVDDTYAFWFDQNHLEAWRRDKTFTAGAELLAASFPALPIVDMAYDDASLYFVTLDGTLLAVSKANVYPFDGGPDAAPPVIDDAGAATIAHVSAGVKAMTSSATTLYLTRWTMGADGEVVMIPKDGSPPVTVANGQTDPRDLVLDDSYVYWTSYGDGTVRRASRPDAPAQ